MQEKAKAAPKQLIRRGLDDGTERLRGQFRETAQRGQASDYGGDRIEDAAARGAYQARRGVEVLLKKSSKNRLQEKKPHTESDPPMPESPADPPPLPESPTGPPSPHEPPPREQPRIKTREAVSARESGAVAGPSESGRAKPSPGERMRQTQIKTRESAVHDPHPDVPSVRQAGSEPPQVRTREPAVYDIPIDVEPAPRVRSEPPKVKTRDVSSVHPPAHGAAEPSSNSQKSPDWLSIKTREAYIQSQPASMPEQPSQAFVQGRQEFIQERGRSAAMKRAEVQRVTDSAGTGHPIRNGGETTPPAPARRGYAGRQGKYAPVQPVRGPVSPGKSDSRPVRDSGRTIIKTARSGRKTTERTARHAIKMAEWSSRKTIKTAQRTAKTATRTAKTAGQTAKTAQKTAQTTVKATQRAVQTARATAKAAAATAKAAAKATMTAIKAAIAATKILVAAIAGASLPVLLVVVVICLVGLIAASPFGIFLGIFFPGGGSSPDAVSLSAAISEINSEYADKLSALQADGTYDRVEIQGGPPSWVNVLAVFSAKTTTGGGENAAVPGADNTEQLKVVFWDMTKITSAETEVEHPAEGDTPAWTEKVLTITVTPRTSDDMRVFYSFTDAQNKALDELLARENDAMWKELLYGSSSDIVAVALSQVGNVGGQPYWNWYGFNSRVEWCACFVSWCANECGYIDAGVIPKFAGCTGGSNWFKNRGQWQDGSYEPRPGDLIFFDWDNKGSSGPQDDVPDHVGIVERVENGVVMLYHFS